MELSGQPHAPAAAVLWQLLRCLPDIWHTDNSVVLYFYIPVRLQGVTATLCHCVVDILSSRGGRGCSQYPPEYKMAAPCLRLIARSATESQTASLNSFCDVEHKNYAGVFYFQNIGHIQGTTRDTVRVCTFRPIRKYGLPFSDFHKRIAPTWQHYVEISYAEFNQNRKINVEVQK
jgi:hypothetical protein